MVNAVRTADGEALCIYITSSRFPRAEIKSGTGFDLASDTITDKAVLRSKIEAMREKMQSLRREVDALKNGETFEVIQGLDEWDEYFDTIRQQLIEEYNSLVGGDVFLAE